MASWDQLRGAGLSASAISRAARSGRLHRIHPRVYAVEDRFLTLCERDGLPLPEVNARIAGMKADMLWRDQRLVVELDGGAAHGRPSAVPRDRERELVLRERGYRVQRYSARQIDAQPERVLADVRAALS